MYVQAGRRLTKERLAFSDSVLPAQLFPPFSALCNQRVGRADLFPALDGLQEIVF